MEAMQTATADAAARYRFRFDAYGLDGFVERAAAFEPGRFGYVVTPNVDHLVRLNDSAQFRSLYAAASYVLLDSRLLAKLLRLFRRQHVPVCTGSDLTRVLFERVIQPHDRVVLIGARDEQAEALRRRYGLRQLAHHNPPMGFIRDPQQVEQCLQFVEAQSPSRFTLLAVGSPQQEMLALALQQRGRAHGLALCVGASIDFLTGAERRAPQWMQQAGLEWLYRLAQNPSRLARRYLHDARHLFGLVFRGRYEVRQPAVVAQDA